jgi:hypothetical protein
MFKFDISKMKVQNVRVTAVTEALGGSIRVVDELATVQGKLVTKRMEIPYAVARAFKKLNKNSTFLVPVQVAITSYNGMIVNIEKKLPNGILDDDGKWISSSDFTLRRILPSIIKEGDWYIDGVTIYKVPQDWKNNVTSQPLTSCKRFFGVTVSALKLSNMHMPRLMENPMTRSCVAFQHKNDYILSPAIWTNVMDIRGTQAKIAKQEQCDDNTSQRFDALESLYFVNLEFVLSAAKKLGGLFGYEHIAFLELDRHMINLNTVNLPQVPKAIRSTYDTQKTFKLCLAWLFGYLNRCETIEQYVAIRGLIKMLCNIGLFERKSVESMLDKEAPDVVERETALYNVFSKWKELSIASYFLNKGVKADDGEGVKQLLVGTSD